MRYGLCRRSALRWIVLLVSWLVLVGFDYGHTVPSWVVWHEVTMPCRVEGLEGDAVLTVQRSEASLTYRGADLCDMPDEWRVQDGTVADIDRDGRDEVVLLTWRQRDFGTSRPFWEGELNDEEDWTQHLFVLRPEMVDDGSCRLKQIWMTSRIDMDVDSLAIQDGRLRLRHRDGLTTLWEWQTWGLSLVEDDPRALEAEDGSSHLAFERALDDDSAALAQGESDISILVSGDVICHESMYLQAWDGAASYDFSPLFREIRPYMDTFDMRVACEETVFVHDPAQVSTYPFFGTPCAMGDALAGAGFDVVCAASNHAADKGPKGVEDTLLYWRDRHPEMTLLGLHEGVWERSVRTKEVRGYNVAFVNATESLNLQTLPSAAHVTIDTFERLPSLLAEVRDASRKAALTVCVLHTGIEYASEPSLTQRIVAEWFVDAGADVVVCTHSHVIQPVERVTTAMGRTGIVYWSLGNLISHQTGTETVLGGLANVMVGRNEDGDVVIRSYGLVPVVAHFDGDETFACLLSEYTAELAARHSINRINTGSVSSRALRTQWDRVRERCQ